MVVRVTLKRFLSAFSDNVGHTCGIIVVFDSPQKTIKGYGAPAHELVLNLLEFLDQLRAERLYPMMSEEES